MAATVRKLSAPLQLDIIPDPYRLSRFQGMPAVFDREWRKISSLEPCSISDVEGFIGRHYLGKRPAIVLLALKMIALAAPVGCIVFAAPPKEVELRYGGTTWELARLYLLDDIPRNAETWLIAKSIKYIRRNHPGTSYLVSYADPAVGHAGVVYRASNWISDGMTDEGRKTARFDYLDVKTGKKYGRKGNVPPTADLKRVPRSSKHRFLYCMNGVPPTAPPQEAD
jgi:hypothetical protein